jgi:hypothetical protein
VQRGLDDAWRDGVDADAAGGVLDGQRPGDRGQAAFVSAASAVGSAESAWSATLALMLTTWLLCCFSMWPMALAQPEESGEVDPGDQRVALGGVVGEWLGDQDACVVDQGVDAPKRSSAWLMIWSAVACSQMSPSTVRTSGSFDGLMLREFATTAQRRCRYRSTWPAPIPCEPPVTTATFCGLSFTAFRSHVLGLQPGGELGNDVRR